MKKTKLLASGLAFACTLAVPSTSSARTVYDAGAALRANCTAETGAYANPYTNENGGVWSYIRSANATISGGTQLFPGHAVRAYGGIANSLAGFGTAGNPSALSPSVKVNISGSALPTKGEPLLADEMLLFPSGDTTYPFSCVRFTVQEAGWYSAFASFHDMAEQSAEKIDKYSGADVHVLVNGKNQVNGIVSLENVTGSSPRFDFQLPVRFLSAGDTIDVVVGRNGTSDTSANGNDDTGVTFLVTKEDEGAFYDSGIAMTNNLATRYENPYGSIAEGTWYYLLATAASSTTPLANVSRQATSRFKESGANSSQNGFFIEDRIGLSPYFVANETASLQANIAPCELRVHTHADDNSYTKWPVLRFRPPVSGFYSASIVARDVARGTASNANGVDVYLYVADTLVTNAYVSLESFASTAHLTFDSRLMAAGEPIDIVVSPSGDYQSDATGISAIFRRDADVADAGASLMANFQPGASPSNPFADATVANATWTVGNAADATVPTFLTASAELDVDGGALGWRGYARNASGTSRIAIATNGVAGVDSEYLKNMATLLSISAGEMFSQPYHTGTSYACPVMRGTVAEDGLYRVRAYGRDVVNSGGDGIRLGIGVSGAIASFAAISRDPDTTVAYESAVEADTLWLRAGDSLHVVIDPQLDLASSENTATSDGTGFGACYVRTGDLPASRVINVDIGAAATGRLSSFAGRGREGWSDWTAWNALRTGTAASATVENCREADGTTPRNVTVALSGAVAAASGSTGCAMLDSGASDSCTFTVSKLTPNAAYTLYLYGTGDAAFTVGGETKSLDGLWFRTDYEPCFARFETTADANGEIAGTFAAASSAGAAFSGLSIVGEFPEYVPGAFVMVVR